MHCFAILYQFYPSEEPLRGHDHLVAGFTETYQGSSYINAKTNVLTRNFEPKMFFSSLL